MAPELGIDDITKLIHDFETAGLAVDYRIDGQCELVSPGTGLGIYRICQESLANVVKHAPGVKADMEVQISPSSISLSITNDIPSPVPHTVRDAYGGAGLRGMKQRAQLLGGFPVASPERSLWTVKAQIPLSNQESQSNDCASRS
jgi:signal transduction histidine kinase